MIPDQISEQRHFCRLDIQIVHESRHFEEDYTNRSHDDMEFLISQWSTESHTSTAVGLTFARL